MSLLSILWREQWQVGKSHLLQQPSNEGLPRRWGLRLHVGRWVCERECKVRLTFPYVCSRAHLFPCMSLTFSAVCAQLCWLTGGRFVCKYCPSISPRALKMHTCASICVCTQTLTHSHTHSHTHTRCHEVTSRALGSHCWSKQNVKWIFMIMCPGCF